MTRVCQCLILMAWVAAAPAARAGDRDSVLADKAFDVLRRHCHECHGAKETPAAKLKVFDFARLLDPSRGLIVPRDPRLSELVARVECGSMPPGHKPRLSPDEVQTLRDWVAAGTPTSTTPDLLADVRKVSDKDRQTFRYVSFGHLLAGEDPLEKVRLTRAALEKTLRQFAAQGKEDLLTPVGETGLLFRIDLRHYDWHLKPFEYVHAAGQTEPAPINVFDLLLLEYPFGELPPDEVRREYVVPAKLARPVAFVRGDWLAVRAASAPFDKELKPGGADFDPPAELAALRKEVAEAAKTFRPGVAPLDTVSLTPNGGTATFDLEFSTNKRDNTFKVDEAIRMLIRNPTEGQVWVEVIYTDSNRAKFVLSPPVPLKKGETLQLPPGGKEASTDTPGTDFVTVFVSDKELPAGKVLRAKGFQDRYVHPFFGVGADGKITDEPTDVRVRSFALTILK